jgi:hypothetical protein
MANAMDNSLPFTIILITGDRDFAYLVSILTLRRYHVIVIVPPNHHSSLTCQASAVLDWNTEIIQQPNKSTVVALSDSAPLASPAEPFDFPNTFPVSSSKQVTGTITLVPPVTLALYITEPAGAYNLGQLAAALPRVTKKQKRLLKKQSTTAPGTTSHFPPALEAPENGKILQQGASYAGAPLQITLDPPLAPAVQEPSTSTSAIPNVQLETGEPKVVYDLCHLV